MTALVDASGVALELAHPPRRVVSLIPSTTETLCRLGLADALVGVTAYCVEPREVARTKTKVGGEESPDLEATRALALDLVIANVEEKKRGRRTTWTRTTTCGRRGSNGMIEAAMALLGAPRSVVPKAARRQGNSGSGGAAAVDGGAARGVGALTKPEATPR